MADIFRVVVPLDSYSDDAFKLAFGYASEICRQTGAADIIVLTHTKSQLDHTSLSRLLGATTVKALAKGPVALSSGGRLHAETMKTFKGPGRPSVLVVYYGEKSILDFADGARNVAGIVTVPDLPGTADEWALRWGAVVHGQDRKAPGTLIKDEVIVRALEELTRMINLSTGLGHPRDKEYADQVLRILRAKGHEDPTAAIKSWAIVSGWKPEHASKLEDLSRKIWELKGKPSLAKFHKPLDRYERWRTGRD